MTRRTLAAAAVSAVSYNRILGASDRVRLGFIGVGNRGTSLLRATREYGDQEIVAVCDVRRDYMDNAVQAAGTAPAMIGDYRTLLGRSDIDAVVIATSDHWHALMTVDACLAGKDVYVEKPLSLTVREGRRMVEVAKQTERVVQVGIHRRSAAGRRLGSVSGASSGRRVQPEPPQLQLPVVLRLFRRAAHR